MNTYFDGLMNTGAITNFSLFKNIPETESSIKQVDINTFKGSIKIYDEFFAKEMVTLNVIIKSNYCPIKEKYLVWFYLSPKENSHPIWKELMEIKLNIKCH
ncbi:hypothetical protein [Aquimarina sp. Aq78]|nr:hypothetical protein [Aquimarina sp. Aq78]